MDLKSLTIKKASDHLKKGDFSAVELTQAYHDEITKKNKDINAYLEVFDDALDAAKQADEKIADARKTRKEISPLAGIPCGVKDNILIKGKIASAASKILENYHATYDATVIKKLAANGAVFLGRTNMDEFAMGGSTENSAFGVTKNPYDLGRVAGGSSGGSAAAVAMDGALFALGSDTGGSIRQPASFCGVVGLKPTYGAVSRYGVMAMGSSLDQIGPIAKTASDAEIVFNAIKGNDLKDGTMIKDNTYTKKRIGKNKPVIGVPRHFLAGDGIDHEVLKAFNEAVDLFKAKGYEMKEIKLPNISYALMVYYIIMPAEVSSNLARFDGVKYGLRKNGKDGIDDYFETRRVGFGREVIRRILLGTYVLSSGYYDAYYNRANAVRRMITGDFLKAFESVDAIAMPTAPSPAFKIGEKASDPVAMYLEDIFTVTANLTGLPAISIPCGFAENSGKKLPVGLQLTARHGDESTLFETGKDFLGES
ncbi:Asp-tRNA(Asn)/Glu-tRNA(Gln) amidotransferase subunit GatA [Patescibacteria group bacterium]|nr:Asp-tRNA(Asn)/Glu-tRNA(Gln) amidotransferase subunit GatA [Patescibacteria group bacterium]MDE1946745.1 Asp-tRNA(Asn)/Glu-tRNA(Gln) amidotransferase subunit GatA [Patescibacteria group bacterium]MDE2010952.1 Asp-tRNA(Asn)/Glu-tRNA(Gln) amidotransferase subunit GatA [Patescibacteria group bacterium]MDE2233559.1 Asp-tRNA(Asn)/Glu-tRNA(Gln) amidotransferase subunit GatA [Patescibacteria group bacterium]